MTPQQAIAYIGHEWESGANGPDKWDCWHFLQHVQRTYFDRQLPDAPIGDPEGCRAVYDQEMANGHWKRVMEPEHGDAVSMRSGSWPHVGVWLDIDGGKILHCCEGHGVIASRPSTLRTMVFGRLKFYRIIKE